MTPDPVLTECLEVLVDGGDLSRTQAERAVGVMMDGAAGEVQMAAFLTALRAKGVTSVELAGLAQAVRDRAAHVPVDDVHGLVDTCGTGGGPPTVNISTGAAFIAAAAGARVAKHGNRAVTSSSGSADVLEALGARVDLAPEAVATCIAQVGVGFMFAPAHHPAFRHVGPVRRELGIRTAFNLIGPLANPAGARNQVVGVYDRAQVEVVAEALSLLGARRALVVAGRDGLDEISTGAPTDAVLWEHDGFSPVVIDPAALGITPPPAGALEVGDAAASAALLHAAIGEAGPVRDILVLNAGAAVWMADLAHSLEKGMEMAEEAVRSGAARERLEGFVALTNDLAPGEEGLVMSTFLDEVVERTRADVEARRREVPLEALQDRLDPAPRNRPFSEGLVQEGISLIAEMKRASPSKGPIRPDATVTDIVRAYEAAGASACSVLTEPHWFGGSLDDLREARAACGLPLLRKDFIVDRYQIAEARLAGADAILLIVAALDPGELMALHEQASEIGLDCLVEVHDEDEMETAVGCGVEIIGVNNRNLHTLDVDPDTALRLLVDAPAGTIVVAESGITSNDDVQRLEEAGVDAILVGEALMREDDPAGAVHALLGTRSHG